MNLKDIPIRQKVTLVIMLTSAVVLFLTTAAFLSYEVFSSHRSVVQNSQTIAQITAAQSSAAVYFEDQKGCQEILSKLTAESRILLAALYAKDGKMLARYPATEPVTSFPPSPVPKKYEIAGEKLNIFTPVSQDNQVVGTLFLTWDLSYAYRRLRWYAGMVGLVLICSLGIALAISRWLQRGISVPILALAETAEKVSRGDDYSIRAKKYGNDELGHFTDSFNNMLAQIHTQNEALRKNEEQLRGALQATEAAAQEVRALNAELENRVAHRTAELAATNQELEAFAYSVSHDLRAPLRHIDAYAQILEEDIEKNPADARQYLGRIRLGVQNMGRLVDDLLKLSRIGRVEPKFETVALNPIVDEVLAEMKLEIENRAVEWRIAKLPRATVDAGLIKQVFANLISNAVKYSRPRALAIIEIGAEPAGGGIAIFVRDNGVGFNMKYAHKLFGVFQRLHRMEDFEGTGVGLATVERIVRLHGGKIWVNAELDKGATFHFTLKGIEAAQPL
jgi:signal transduction histidine kinase